MYGIRSSISTFAAGAARYLRIWVQFCLLGCYIYYNPGKMFALPRILSFRVVGRYMAVTTTLMLYMHHAQISISLTGFLQKQIPHFFSEVTQ